MANWDALSVAGDVADAGTALAGLILVYLGTLAVRYESLDTAKQSDLRKYYRGHAWLAFSGIVIALGSAAAALIAESIKSECLASVAAVSLFLSFLGGIAAAFWTVTSIQ